MTSAHHPTDAWLRSNDATALAALVRDRLVSPRELVDSFLRRIEAVEPELNACCQIFDGEAEAAAEAAERTLQDGEPIGPLHGVPVGVKESIWIADKRSTSGSRAYAEFVAPEDAVSVSRLRAAGAIVLIQTTMSELGCAGHTATSLFGVTRNPWDPQRSPGGSSGGSGAAVAGRMVPLALGTDAAGSVRKPAAFCGLAAIKPTFGLIPIGPGVEHYETLVALGPMAHSVRDLALALDVLSGFDPRDPRSLPMPSTDAVSELERDLRRVPRVALSADLGVAKVAPGVREVFDQAVAVIAALGWQQEQVSPPAAAIDDLVWRVLLAETGRMPVGREHLIDDPEAREIYVNASSVLSVDSHEAAVARGHVTRAWDEFFDEHDLLITPTVAFEPPPTDPGLARLVWHEFASGFAILAAANLTGQPAVTVPAGLSSAGLPVGIQIIGPRGSDARCLAAARVIESALGPFPSAPEALPRMRGASDA